MMRASRALRTILFVCAIPLVMASDCGDTLTAAGQVLADMKEIEITMRNSDTLPVHLFFSGEFFPCCQVAPQGSRTGTGMLQPEMTAEFRAGRNGEVLANKVCTLTKTGYDAGKASVVFTGGGLTCSGW